jgi:hypothetical protein
MTSQMRSWLVSKRIKRQTLPDTRYLPSGVSPFDFEVAILNEMRLSEVFYCAARVVGGKRGQISLDAGATCSSPVCSSAGGDTAMWCLKSFPSQ